MKNTNTKTKKTTTKSAANKNTKVTKKVEKKAKWSLGTLLNTSILASLLVAFITITVLLWVSNSCGDKDLAICGWMAIGAGSVFSLAGLVLAPIGAIAMSAVIIRAIRMMAANQKDNTVWTYVLFVIAVLLTAVWWYAAIVAWMIFL